MLCYVMDVMWCCLVLYYAMRCHVVMFCYTMFCYVMLWYVLCGAVLYYAILCDVMLCFVMLCYDMCYVVLCCDVLCYAMRCHVVMFWYIMFCYVMLCYAMLCYVVLCCAVLYYIIFLIFLSSTLIYTVPSYRQQVKSGSHSWNKKKHWNKQAQENPNVDMHDVSTEKRRIFPFLLPFSFVCTSPYLARFAIVRVSYKSVLLDFLQVCTPRKHLRSLTA